MVALASGVIMAIGAIVQGSFRLAIAAIVNSDLPPEERLPLWRFDPAMVVLLWGSAGLVATMCLSAFTVSLLPRVFGGVGAVLIAASGILVARSEPREST